MNLFRRFRRWITGADHVERMVRDFQRDFPDECIICSYRRYGMRELGIFTPAKPHYCPENPPRPSRFTRNEPL